MIKKINLFIYNKTKFLKIIITIIILITLHFLIKNYLLEKRTIRDDIINTSTENINKNGISGNKIDNDSETDIRKLIENL